MKAIRSTLATTVLLTALLAPARAADVPVSYTVDETALKTAISGTSLTFTLYTDAACTTLVHTQVVNVENVTVISKLKRFKPNGAAKPPKTDDLRTTLTSVTPAAPLYLKVTGTGITPVGGACQVQAAGVAGLPGATTGFVVKDSNGATVGVLAAGPQYTYDSALRKVGAVMVRVAVLETSFAPAFANVYYTSTDCSGPGQYQSDPLLTKNGSVAGTTLYFGVSNGAFATMNSAVAHSGMFTSQGACDAFYGLGNSTFTPPEGCCVPNSYGSLFVGPVQTDDLSAFVPPFSVE